MKFLVDAQLPRRLVLRLREAGHDAVHTLDLPNGNRTSDAQVNAISIAEQRVVITKDSDFVDSFLLQKLPWKLLLVSTGNISNRDLERLFAANLSSIANGFLTHDYIEITRANVIFHC
jgi:predicted nuclease of predicted toxin-antitoxin system